MSEAGGIFSLGSNSHTWFHAMGRTVGAIVCTGFGAYSMYCSMGAIQRARAAWFCAIAIVTTILLISAIAEIAALRHTPRSAPDKHYRRLYAIGFNGIVAVEVAAINLGGPILAHFHRPDLYPQWVDLVVGIHFLPLGKLFKLPLYYVTGFAISLLALGSLLFPPGPLRLVVSATGMGLTLWATAAIILTKNLAYLPVKRAVGVSTG